MGLQASRKYHTLKSRIIMNLKFYFVPQSEHVCFIKTNACEEIIVVVFRVP
jgi:hypothetical protein